MKRFALLTHIVAYLGFGFIIQARKQAFCQRKNFKAVIVKRIEEKESFEREAEDGKNTSPE